MKAQRHNKKCTEIENYDKKHDSFHLHKKLKGVAGSKREHSPQKLEDYNGIVDYNEKLNSWKNYAAQSFGDERSKHHISTAISGPSITKKEIKLATELAKNGKANSLDNLSVEILKLLGKIG